MLEQSCPVSLSELLYDQETGMSNEDNIVLQEQIKSVLPEAFKAVLADEDEFKEAILDCTGTILTIMLDSEKRFLDDSDFKNFGHRIVNSMNQALKERVEQKAYEILQGVS